MYVLKRTVSVESSLLTSEGERVDDGGEGESEDVESAKHGTPQGEGTTQPVWEGRTGGGGGGGGSPGERLQKVGDGRKKGWINY